MQQTEKVKSRLQNMRDQTLLVKEIINLQELIDSGKAKARIKRSIVRLLNNFDDFRWRVYYSIVKKENTRVRIRDIIIPNCFIGKTISVYNGKSYIPVSITEDMVASYIGEYVPTRKSVKHGSVGVGGVKSSKFKIAK